VSAPSPAETFLQEAQDLLEQLEHSLLELESQPGNSELIDAAFRALHTIKGSGAMFGFTAVAGFTHHVETAFDRVRQGTLAVEGRLIALALAARDHIRRMIEQPGPEDEALAAPILAGLQALLAAQADAPARPAAPPAAAEPLQTAAQGWRIRMRLARDAMQMGTNPLLLLDELRSLGTATVMAHADDVPPLEALDPAACHFSWSVALQTALPRSAIDDVFLFVIDDMQLDVEPALPAVAPAEMVLAPVLPGSIPAPHAVVSSVPSAEESTRDVNPPAAAAKASGEHANRRLADSVRVPAERLDDLMDRVGELVIAQSRLSQVAAASTDAQVKSIAEDIERLALELRDSTMGVRTVPIGSLFGRFRRLVHDLSAQLGKEIALVTVGEETELDKTVVEKLNDPLIHLLRNSIDHGLEQPDMRAAAGKPPCGRITLTARHAGAEVLISIADDGRGLDRARIRARAEERGMVQPGQSLLDSELFAVIFQPGFSTAREVTSLSGRGVGMDVVKQAIEALRGKIEIGSVPGAGTDLTLRLPLTLAIIDGLLVRVGTARYVLPLSSVEECVELSAAQDARSRAHNFLNIRGDLVPFLRLRALFNVATPPDIYQKIVVVSAGKQRIGLVVDQVIGNHQTVIKSLSVLHESARMFSGATILGDGAVALILDVGRLVEFGQTNEHEFRAAS
jgi:two-component system chemotaxis sensor kinase CheA